MERALFNELSRSDCLPSWAQSRIINDPKQDDVLDWLIDVMAGDGTDTETKLATILYGILTLEKTNG